MPLIAPDAYYAATPIFRSDGWLDIACQYFRFRRYGLSLRFSGCCIFFAGQIFFTPCASFAHLETLMPSFIAGYFRFHAIIAVTPPPYCCQ
jgi:hypothetical protein